MPCKDRLFDVWPATGVESRVLWAILNSSIVALTKTQFGRPAGIEGNLDTDVIDVQMMLVPDPRNATKEIAKRLIDAATRLSRRTLRRYLYEEFELADRRDLDEAVLELLGIEDAEERAALRQRIYEAIETDYRATREREQIAQRDRARSNRGGRRSATELAKDVWEIERDNFTLLHFPQDFVRTRRNTIRFNLPSGKVEVGRAMLETGRLVPAGSIRVGGATGTVHVVGSVAQCEFLEAVSECGRYGLVEIPRDDQQCMDALKEFERYRAELQARFTEFAERRTNDASKQRAIVKALMRLALQSGSA
jgi:hypothetical protein